MPSQSPTSRSLVHARINRWPIDIVERRIPYSNKTKDLFGFIDLIVLIDGQIVGVQVTDSTHHATRRKKILASKNLAPWLACGAAVEVWSWGLRGKTGKRKLWTLRRERITTEEGGA